MTADKWSLLHVTDLHVADPDGSLELLRRGYYEEYLNQMVRCLQKNGAPQADGLIITGDFVHQGNPDNWPHVQTVVDYLAKQLQLTKANVAVCIGNHDVVRELDKGDNPRDARRRYIEFSQNYANGSPKTKNERAVLCSPCEGVSCLMIDATIGGQGGEKPGTLSPLEEDDLIRLVRSVPTTELLVVGTHYFVETYPQMIYPYEHRKVEPQWFEKHLWICAIGLRERIRRVRDGAPTVWLCGDVHFPSHVTAENQHFVITGRLGTSVAPNETLHPRQAKLVTIAHDPRTPPTVHTAIYRMPGGSPQAQYGDWIHEEDEIVVVERRPAARFQQGVQCNAPLQTGRFAPAETIHIPLEEEIINVVRSCGLYKLGRFRTAGDEVSLSWVSVGPLMNTGNILPPLVDRMSGWLKGKLGADLEQTVLLGLDCWGAVLASQISVRTGAHNFCIAARGRGRHYTSHEVVNRTVTERVSDARAVVLVTDVLATGSSLRYLYDEVCKGFVSEKARALRWLALSVVCDAMRQRSVDCSFLESHGTGCARLRMPSVPASALPDEDILPPDLSFA